MAIDRYIVHFMRTRGDKKTEDCADNFQLKIES